jgi:HAD superfamily hydrolase (TIGR01490 family)
MKKFAVFDIDGTLIRWQLYHAVVDKLAKKGLLGNDAQQKIHSARMRWKNREANYGFHEYEVELIHIFTEALEQLETNDFNSAVNEVIKEYKDQAYTYTRGLMRELKKAGYMLIAISGSQQELVAKISKHYGFDDYVGTQYQKKGANFTGEVFVASHNKKALLNTLIKKHKLDLSDSFAVGDSKNDAVMLEMVKHPIAFNPDEDLYQIATKKHWPIVLERKNVVYRLEYKDGTYILT